jgi:hypothetical protein
MSERSELQPQEELEGSQDQELEEITQDPAAKAEQTGSYREAEEIETAFTEITDHQILEEGQIELGRIPGMDEMEQVNLNDPPQEADAEIEPIQSSPSEDPAPTVTPINIPRPEKSKLPPISKDPEVTGIKLKKEGEEPIIPAENDDPIPR